VEDDVENPMKTVFDLPMGAGGAGKKDCVGWQGDARMAEGTTFDIARARRGRIGKRQGDFP
jgi:hypothetical protein